jgi:hypothetical protein
MSCASTQLAATSQTLGSFYDWNPIQVDTGESFLIQFVAWGFDSTEFGDKMLNFTNSIGYRVKLTNLLIVWESSCNNIEHLEELKQKHMPQLQVIQDESNSMDKSNQHISKPQRNSVHKETKRELFLYLLRILHQLLMNGGDEAKYFVRDSDSQDHLPDPERSSPIQTNSTTNEANEQQQPRSIQLSLKTKLGFFPFSWTFDFTPISHSATFIRDYLIFPLFAISKELNRQNEILAQFVTERDCLIQEYKQRSETAPCKSLSQSLHFDYEDFLNTHLSSSEFREAISNPLSKFEHASKLIYEKYFLLKDDSQRTVTTDGNFDTLSCPTHDELVLVSLH